jgi:hypothetical protein
MTKRLAIVIAVVATGMLAMASTAGAATIKVTNTNDSGPGSFRSGITLANNHPGSDRILVQATGTIKLQRPIRDLSSAISIEGPGASHLSVNGAGSYHENDPSTLVVAKSGRVSVRGLSLVDARTAIENDGGVVTVVDSSLEGNVDGIRSSGVLTVLDSSLVNNSYGDAIVNTGSMQVRRSTVRDNGGAIDNEGPATISQSTLVDNPYGVTNSGTLVVARSTLSGGGLHTGAS